MNNGFDKKAFEKKQKKLDWACILIAAIGIASVILAVVVGSGIGLSFTADSEEQKPEIHENDDFGEDPKDYYGSYYGVKDYVIYRVDITDDEATFVTSDAFGENVETYAYQYVDAEYAKEKLNKACPAIIFYTDTIDTADMFLWVNSDETGIYLYSDALTFYTDVISFDSLMNDPKDYYGTYYAEIKGTYNIEKLTISETGVETITNNGIVEGEAKNYKYTFLCAEYTYIKYGKNYDALVIYDKDISHAVKVLYLSGSSDKYFLLTSDGYEYTTNELTVGMLTNDPMNYYGDYVYSTGNSLTLNADYTAPLTLNGESEELKYFYANEEWTSLYLTQKCDNSIILHNNSEDYIQIFTFTEDGNLIFGDLYVFEKQ